MSPLRIFTFSISLCALIGFSSCGLVQKVAVGTTADLLLEASPQPETEGNWDALREGLPANIKLMEGLLYLEPENEKLLIALIKGYAGVAFAVHETLYLKDQLKDKEASHHRQQAIVHYSKALEYADRYLQEQGTSLSELFKRMNEPKGVVETLEDEVDDGDEDLQAILFTAQSLGALINLQKTDMKMISHLPLVKGMFDWVCAKKPDINFGSCHIFYGAYEAGRPRMLGGSPEKGKRIFLDLINQYPSNWLARVTYIQYYLIPMGDEKGYREQRNYLDDATERHYEQLRWTLSKEKSSEFEKERLRAYQSVAIKRFEIIRQLEKDIF